VLGNLYDRALAGERCWIRHDDGSVHGLPVHSWLVGGGKPDHTFDQAVVGLCTGPTIDLGCGPGRFVAHLTKLGIPALGVDQSQTAVELARRSGAPALRRDVFERLPGTGRWETVLLADGNVGIGGDPQRLLRRVRDLLRPGGQAHVEVGGHGARHGVVRARLRGRDGTSGSWFPWAHVSVGGLEPLAEAAGLSLVRVWEVGGRCFADLSS